MKLSRRAKTLKTDEWGIFGMRTSKIIENPEWTSKKNAVGGKAKPKLKPE